MINATAINAVPVLGLSILNHVIKKGRPHGNRHGKTDPQKEHFIAHNFKKKNASKKNFEGIHDRF